MAKNNKNKSLMVIVLVLVALVGAGAAVLNRDRGYRDLRAHDLAPFFFLALPLAASSFIILV